MCLPQVWGILLLKTRQEEWILGSMCNICPAPHYCLPESPSQGSSKGKCQEEPWIQVALTGYMWR